jgi:hypothetical protein
MSRHLSRHAPRISKHSLVILSVLVLLLLSVFPTHAGGWIFLCVDCSKFFAFMTDRSLRLDASGHPHLAYGGDYLYYAWHDGTSWHYETVDQSPGVGEYASLALSAGGYAHIAYLDDVNRTLKYAYRDASGWHLAVVATGLGPSAHSSVALDGNGHPHISYLGSGELMYAYKDFLGWHTEAVDSEGGEYTSLVLDAAGRPHISYYDSYPDDAVKYAYRSRFGWIISTVESYLGDEAGHTSLALDQNGFPHISYLGWGDSSDYSLRYAYQDAAGWHIDVLDELVGASGGYTSLVFDVSDGPHLSYYDSRLR